VSEHRAGAGGGVGADRGARHRPRERRGQEQQEPAQDARHPTRPSGPFGEIRGCCERRRGEGDHGDRQTNTTTNARCFDSAYAGCLGQSPENVARERELISCLREIGVMTTDTCINYQAVYQPHLGEHVAWGDTGTVIYANSYGRGFPSRPHHRGREHRRQGPLLPDREGRHRGRVGVLRPREQGPRAEGHRFRKDQPRHGAGRRLRRDHHHRGMAGRSFPKILHRRHGQGRPAGKRISVSKRA
jgi:hypothetical protein